MIGVVNFLLQYIFGAFVTNKYLFTLMCKKKSCFEKEDLIP